MCLCHRLKVIELTGRRTVPQIFFNGRYIGGNDDFQALVSSSLLIGWVGGSLWIVVEDLAGIENGSLSVSHDLCFTQLCRLML